MIRKALLLIPALAFAASARAQFSVYGTVTLNHMSGIASSPLTNTLSPEPCTAALLAAGTPCTSYKSSVDPIGFAGGITYGFKTIGPIRLSADARGVVESNHQGGQSDAEGAGTRIYSALGGLKATFHTPVRFLFPYVQGSVGYAKSNYGILTNAQITNTTTKYPGIPTQNNLQYGGFAGLDIKMIPAVDFRIVEVGYGALMATGTYSHTYPILSISSGFVFHIPPRQ